MRAGSGKVPSVPVVVPVASGAAEGKTPAVAAPVSPLVDISEVFMRPIDDALSAVRLRQEEAAMSRLQHSQSQKVMVLPDHKPSTAEQLKASIYFSAGKSPQKELHKDQVNYWANHWDSNMEFAKRNGYQVLFKRGPDKWALPGNV